MNYQVQHQQAQQLQNQLQYHQHQNFSSHVNVSDEIRQEIQRFESVHPSIYAIYDLIEGIEDLNLQSQIRDHVVNIEDSFVNSQEWTTSRSVPDLKLGIVGYVNSGKSALVHRYLTGSYMQEESPEGGRFKKEINIDGQSYLLLIRDEGGVPEAQFTNWVDVVVFVFSVENELSFTAVHSYYNKMCHYRDMSQMPIILVGTQDAIDDDSHPRLIDESRVKQLEMELGARCRYYETCATYGLNVEQVFQDACQRAIQEKARLAYSMAGRVNGTSHRPHGVSNMTNGPYANPRMLFQPATSASRTMEATTPKYNRSDTSPDTQSSPAMMRDHGMSSIHWQHERQQRAGSSGSGNFGGSSNSVGRMQHQQQSPAMSQHLPHPSHPSQLSIQSRSSVNSHTTTGSTSSSLNQPSPQERGYTFAEPEGVHDKKTTPNSTPVFNRKGTKKQMTSPRKDDSKIDELGSGRRIPLKQGYLYKKGSKSITKDWKKKYVVLTAGKLIYHPNMHDYMGDNHGKEINLMQTTVKIPGQHKPRLNTQQSNGSANETSIGDGINSSIPKKLSPRDYPSNSSLVPVAGVMAARIDSNTPHIRRKHRRAKSGSKIETNGDGNDSDGYEFTIVSLDNKQWQFEAQTQEERDIWVSSIEKQIFSSLQANDTRKTSQDPNAVQAIKNMPGNNVCSDCGTPNPAWASLNLGSLICMECSGIHRHLGTHHSRVRSLELDEWPPDLTAVMLAIGNQRSNGIWEAKAARSQKPTPNSSREEKEAWIRAKYEQKEYLADRPHRNVPLNHLLIDAIARQEISQVILLLASSTPEDVNSAYSKSDRRTPLHIAAQQGNAIFLQLLLWYGADVRKLDLEGRSALWYAKKVGSKDCAFILQSNGCADVSTLPRLRRGSLRTEPVPLDKHKDRTSLNSLH